MSTVPDFGMAAVAIRRDRWSCVCCGALIARRPFSVRRRNPDAGDSPANLLTFIGDGSRPQDPADHRARADSGLNPADTARGFTVPAGLDPRLVPVMVFSPDGYALVWLDESDAYLTVPPEGTAAA